MTAIAISQPQQQLNIEFLYGWIQLVLPDQACCDCPRLTTQSLAFFHSRFHELWSLKLGTELWKIALVIHPHDCFETFPFPEGVLSDPDPDARDPSHRRSRPPAGGTAR